MPTLRTLTLGCKVNQYETEYVRQALARVGYREASADEPPDLCIVNTCTVTAESDSKSRQAIRRLHRLYPMAEIVVMGCYATRAADEVAALPGVVEVIVDKRELPALLARHGVMDIPTGIFAFGGRRRAYVKVQDGCRMSCSYCIIPRVRPVLISRPLHEALDEIRRLIDAGHREIVLTGIHLGHYGAERAEGDVTLARLLAAAAGLPGDFRLRLSSLEAAECTDDLLAVMADHADRVCPHLHLPLQSGAARVLQRMRRRWPIENYRERCAAARKRLACPALTTDVIVGFPGETEEEFAETRRVVEEIEFARLHVFRFSPREGTAAATFPDRVPIKAQRQRVEELIALGERLEAAFARSLIGSRAEVLIEGAAIGTGVGACRRYQQVSVEGAADDVGRLLRVKIEGANGRALRATRVGP